MRIRVAVVALAAASAAGGWLLFLLSGEHATLPPIAGFGPHPTLPAPHAGLFPTVKVARAVGWPAGKMPAPAPGMTVSALASGLDHPRWLYVLPNGDVLVAETNAPARPADAAGVKGFVATQIMKVAGAEVSSPNRITLLRPGRDGAVQRFTFLTGLNSPFGMALVGSDFYVADTDALVKFPYQAGQTSITAPGVKVTDLPGGPRNHHWTKNVVANADGTKLYVSVGSNSNVAENGMAEEAGRAAIWEVDRATGAHRVFASGLRNPVGMGWEPVTHALWTSVNERDEIGSDLVPDYMTSVRDGGFKRWPYSYYGQHVDSRAQPPRPDLVASAIAPDYALGSHTASLGLAFARPGAMPAGFSEGVFIGQHGSWNRVPLAGYKVIFVPFSSGTPAGTPVDVLTGFLDKDEHAQGRPVGVALDQDGALLVADDVGGVVWKVRK
jgi:glucose/arabinose dehydrogenase